MGHMIFYPMKRFAIKGPILKDPLTLFRYDLKEN